MPNGDRLAWRTSSRSSNNENCVEVAPASDGVVIRHSKYPTAGMIAFTVPAWAAFLREARDGLPGTNGAVPRPNQACSVSGLPVGAVRELDAVDISSPPQVDPVEFTERGTGTYPNDHPGVGKPLEHSDQIAASAKIGTDTVVRSLHTDVELCFNEAEWSAFIAGAADGEFDFADRLAPAAP